MVEVFVFVIIKNFVVIEASEAYEITRTVREVKNDM